jgi:hypothetical protein
MQGYINKNRTLEQDHLLMNTRSTYATFFQAVFANPDKSTAHPWHRVLEVCEKFAKNSKSVHPKTSSKLAEILFAMDDPALLLHMYMAQLHNKKKTEDVVPAGDAEMWRTSEESS